MRRHLAVTLGTVGMLAVSATAHAAYGDSCAFNPTTIFGTDGPDSIVGGGETIDVIFAFGGDDYIAGGTHAEDWLCGGRGNSLYFTAGPDDETHGLFGSMEPTA